MSVEDNIYLVRHGEAAASWGQDPNPGLSELGFQQAELVADRLEKELDGYIIRMATSPLQRARQTSLALQSRVGRSILVEERFREIPAPVPLGQRQFWLQQFMRQLWIMQDETLKVWRDDTQRALTSLTTPAVVFTHFLVINSIVGRLQDRDETLVCWPANGSVTTLRRTDAGIELVELGEEMEGPVG